MTNIYDIIKKTKDFFYAHPLVNEVTFGDITDIDLNKTTIYPLVHFMLGNTTVNSNTIQITLTMLFCDVVNYSKDFNNDDFGYRETSDNLIDIFNTELQIANEFISELKRGDLYRDGYQVVGDPILQPFKDRFENELAGWTTDIVIEMPNNISTC